MFRLVKIRLIGGPEDGRLLEVDQRVIQVGEFNLPVVEGPVWASEKAGPSALSQLKRAIYRHVKFHEPDHQVIPVDYYLFFFKGIY